MGFYSRQIFPLVCDWALRSPAVAAHRQELLAGAKGDILEIGFGTGLNLPHYPAHVRRIGAIDPNPGMHRKAARRIEQTTIEVDKRLAASEQLPFDEATFDCVVSTFTLCSVGDAARSLAEVYRVLRPGGSFLLLEHGLCPDPKVQKWQRRLTWLERRVAGNCHLDRNIQAIVATQPFTNIDLTKFYLEQLPRTHGYAYQGAAIK